MHHLCMIKKTLEKVENIIDSGRVSNAWSRQRCVELHGLLEDISCGRGTLEHLSNMASLVEVLGAQTTDPVCHETAQMVSSALTDHREAFVIHIENRICPTGECVHLKAAPCQMACPAGVDVPGYLHLISQGRDADAIELIRRDNPLPFICGLVCTNPCETQCIRNRMDESVSIRFLKRFAAERALAGGGYKNPEKAPDNGIKVCVVGAGPAGLTAAYFLALQGYRVTVIESLSVPGGMMRVGIPRYRLPASVIDREVGYIRDLGVEFRFDTRLGKDVTFESLKKEKMAAFLLAPGAHASVNLGIEGEQTCSEVRPAIDFLKDVSLGKKPDIGKNVVVIGGGNVAMDAARTSLRLGALSVKIVYRRTLKQMPAMEEEIRQAQEEGVIFSFLSTPVAVENSNGKLTGLRCLKNQMGQPDSSGRSRPVPIESSEFVIAADTVFTAVGQKVIAEDFGFLEKRNWSKKGTIQVDEANMSTRTDGIFAAGDVATGPATVIQAIAGGKVAAMAMDSYLTGKPQRTVPTMPVRRSEPVFKEIEAGQKMALCRAGMPEIGLDERNGFRLIEKGYSEKTVRQEAARCFRCDVCARCGTCVDICREQIGTDALSLWFTEIGKPTRADLEASLKRCIGCGACATNCPTGAMAMEDRGNERVLLFCGTVLNRYTLRTCQQCGEVIAPEKYLDYLTERIAGEGKETLTPSLCPACAAETFMDQAGA